MGTQGPKPVANANYHWEEQPANTPVWQGNVARILGIHDMPVVKTEYMELIAGRFNDMKLPRYMHPDRREAFELLFTTPKCVALLRAAGDSRIDGVLDDAHAKAMDQVERAAHTRAPWEQPDNLIWVNFDHDTSRAGDPNGHRHTVIMNLSRAEKSWKAIELRYVDMEQVAETYRDASMKGLRECGYKLRRVGQEYEVAGVPAEVKARFSSRAESINGYSAELEERKGKPLSRQVKQRIGLYHKPEKGQATHWRERMTDGELDGLHRVRSRSFATLRQERWRHESRAAYHQMRPVEVEQAPERSRDYGFSR